MPVYERVSKEQNVVARYLADVRQIPRLSREEELRAVDEIRQGCTEALNRLVESNLLFVVHVARSYQNLGLPFEDLLNEGNLGLIEAARRYDPSKGTLFLTYAMWWVRKAILRALGEKVQLVRIPHNQQRKIRDIRAAETALHRSLGRAPSTEEISAHVAIRPADVTKLRLVSGGYASLDRTVNEHGEYALVELLRDLGINCEQRMIRSETLHTLKTALGKLNEQQRRVLQLRFGLDGSRGLTLREAGQRVGLSRERVRQIEKTATRRLQEMLGH